MRRYAYLALALAALIIGLTLTRTLSRSVKAIDYAVKLAAAEHMDGCMARIREYRSDLGYDILPEDMHATGMLGDGFNLITTTAGTPDAKRTTANTDMAALMVELLTQAGVKAGDTVGAGFSGSFPAMALATICACEAMDVKLVYIASVGASTYGANLPKLTFPDMAFRLFTDGMIDAPAIAHSMGGMNDIGQDMDFDIVSEIRTRLSDTGIAFIDEPDFAENLAVRMGMYGDIDCFVGVGGNITTSGKGGESGQGVLSAKGVKVSDNSGLLERYLAQGVPAISILNIKQLVTSYGLAYDPEALPKPGASAIYYDTVYPKLPAALALLIALALLVTYRLRERSVRK